MTSQPLLVITTSIDCYSLERETSMKKAESNICLQTQTYLVFHYVNLTKQQD